MTEAQQRLADCRAAIRSILEKGQRVRKGDREVQRAELASLRMLEGQLAAEVATEAVRLGGRGRSRLTYPRI
jgi:alkylation response protein AidB-like acyl-CoA dehydrogenase